MDITKIRNQVVRIIVVLNTLFYKVYSHLFLFVFSFAIVSLIEMVSRHLMFLIWKPGVISC